MASTGDYPKVDGDIFYGEDANKATGVYEGFEEETISVTQADSSQAYSGAYQKHLIRNIGSNTVYLDFDTAASTSDFPLYAGEDIELLGVSTTIHGICDTGLTSTLRIIGMGSTSDSDSITSYSLSVTAANSSQAMSGTVNGVIIRNVGTTHCYVTVDEASTTSKFKLFAGELLRIHKKTVSTVQAICDGGESTTLKILSFGGY